MPLSFKILTATIITGLIFANCSVKKPQFITTLAVTDSLATDAQLDTAVIVLTKRLVQNGFKNAAVTKQGKEIKIQSALSDKIWIKEYLLKKGVLTFYECYSIIDVAAALQQADKMLAAKGKLPLNEAAPGLLFESFNIANLYNDGKAPGYIGLVQKEKIPQLKNYMAAAASVLPADAELLFAKEDENAKKQAIYAVYFIRNNGKQLTVSNHIQNAAAGFDYTNRPNITIQFDPYTSQRWQRMTVANINKTIAIVIDGALVSAPNVISPIEGGKTEIAGSFTKEETKNYATLLNSGYLPVTLVLKNIEPLENK